MSRSFCKPSFFVQYFTADLVLRFYAFKWLFCIAPATLQSFATFPAYLYTVYLSKALTVVYDVRFYVPCHVWPICCTDTYMDL